MLRYNIKMDLCGDYSRMVEYWMQKRGLRTRKVGWDLWYDFFNLQKKTITPGKRKVWFSREFSCPDVVRPGLDLLIAKFQNGETVVPHLSKDALKPSKFDELLYDWGIYHFHLGTTMDVTTGRIMRTGPILFAKVDAENVYCINVYSHDKAALPPWCRQEMVEIVHRNWPETIEQYRFPEAAHAVYPGGRTKVTDQEYAAIRRSHAFTLITAEENAVYAPIGGGMASSGHSVELTRLCDDIWNILKQNERYIQEHINDIIKTIQKVTGPFPDSKALYFKLWHENKKFYVVDIGSSTALIEVELP